MVKDSSDINKLQILQAESNRRAITQLNDFINKNVSFVGLLMFILTLTVIAICLFFVIILNVTWLLILNVLNYTSKPTILKMNVNQKLLLFYKIHKIL